MFNLKKPFTKQFLALPTLNKKKKKKEKKKKKRKKKKEKNTENIAGNEENAGNKHFLPFLQCFPCIYQKSKFALCLLCCLQMLSIWTSLIIYHLVKG